MVLTTYLSDLSDADLMVRAVPGTNHIAWQLGHLIASEHKMMTDSGFKMPELPGGFAESHDKEASISDDSKKFHKKSQYLDWLMQQRTATMAALDAASDTSLGKATPESMKDYALSSVNYPSLSATIILPLGQRNITIIAVSLFFLVLFLCEIVCVPVISVTSRVTLIQRQPCLRPTRSAWPFGPAPCGSWGC
jgi:hypothetical protein